MNESISVSSLVNITDKAKGLQRTRPKVVDRQVSEQILKPLFETLGWGFDDIIDLPGWSKPSITYDAKRNVYFGQLGGQPQLIAASTIDDTSLSKITDLIEYAYNKNTPWALSVSPKKLRLFHTYGNVLLNEVNMAPFWQSELETLARVQADLARYLSASAATNGSLCAIDRDISAHRTVAMPVTRKLFESSRNWRSQMVEKAYLSNLFDRDLNEIDRFVNHILNQIVFIRVAEDRGFGETPHLMEIVNNWRESDNKPGALLSQIRSLIGYYGDRYKVELFSSNTLLNRAITEEPMANLINSLYSPGFPTVKYDFSVIDVDVLGTMYEQYLKLKPQLVDRLGPSVQTRLIGTESLIELRPSADSPGVHYTPPYIVNYIVDSAMRRWHQSKDTNMPPRVLDMACGSGSFLLASYKWLLRLNEKQSGNTLSREDKQTLLKEAIWGVDIDPQAAEICKLNLWLHALEARQSLPNLDNNIKVGDSLLDSSLDDEKPQKIFKNATGKAIQWKHDFPKIMNEGGWDLIIGNPPYIRIQRLQSENKELYLKEFDLLRGNFDISLAFVEMSQRLLKDSGIAGFIIANSLLRSNSASLVRKEITKNKSLVGILDFGDQQVFEGVGAYTCIIFLGKEKTDEPRIGVVYRLAPCPAAQLIRWELQDAYDDTLISGKIGISRLGGGPWVLVPDKEHDLREKLNKVASPLEKIAHIFQGIKTGRDEAFVFKSISEDGHILELMTSKGKPIKIEKELCQPLLKGGDMERFRDLRSKHWVLFPYEDGVLIPEETLKLKYEKGWAYLNTDQIKKLLLSRQGVEGKSKWYGYSRPQSMTLYSKPKILTPDIASQASFAYDEAGRYCFSGGVAGGYGITITQDGIQYEFLLGLLNSLLIDWYVQAIAAPFQGGYYSYEKRFIKDAPIKIGDEQSSEKIVSIVKALRRTYSEVASSSKKENYEVRDIANIISRLESELNDAVMDYYDLTSEEKNLVRMSPHWRKLNPTQRT